jgi:hypothetical protein
LSNHPLRAQRVEPLLDEEGSLRFLLVEEGSLRVPLLVEEGCRHSRRGGGVGAAHEWWSRRSRRAAIGARATVHEADRMRAA